MNLLFRSYLFARHEFNYGSYTIAIFLRIRNLHVLHILIDVSLSSHVPNK